ncbi:MAG: hypothetical protein IPJ43_13220 [Saprospiraceae bacterium]|nr:hypothetical protein [Saprospiraceae bacterium]
MRARKNAIVKDNTLNINVLDRISDGFTILNIELVQFSNNTVNFLGTSSTSTTIRGFDALNTQRLYSYNLSINGSTMVKNRGVDNAMSPYNRYCCTNIKDQKIGVVLSGACNRTRMTKTTYSGVISDVGLNYIDVFIGVPHSFQEMTSQLAFLILQLATLVLEIISIEINL